MRIKHNKCHLFMCPSGTCSCWHYYLNIFISVVKGVIIASLSLERRNSPVHFTTVSTKRPGFLSFHLLQFHREIFRRHQNNTLLKRCQNRWFPITIVSKNIQFLVSYHVGDTSNLTKGCWKKPNNWTKLADLKCKEKQQHT